MRATINFEVDLSEVEDIMVLLVRRESEALRMCAQDIEDVFLGHGREYGQRADETLTDTVGHLTKVTNQLQQYRDMLLSFERAKFETILPQPAAQTTVKEKPVEENPAPPLGDLVRQIRNAQAEAGSMTQFESFVERMKETAAAKGVDVPELYAIEPDQPKKEDTDVEPPSEG